MENKIKEIIVNILDGEKVEINNNTDFIEDLGFDSVKFLSLIIEVESEFNVELDDQDIEEISKFEKFVDTVKKKINDN